VWERLVHDHTGLNIHQIGDLPLDEYLLYRRDAYIYALQQTESGQEYLEKCWLMEQTNPDRGALRDKYGVKGRRKKNGRN